MIDQENSEKTEQSPSAMQQNAAAMPVGTMNAGTEMAQAVSPAAAAPAHDKKAPKDHSKRAFISKGEKATNFGTYAGVDWIFNAAAGVGFAYWGERTAQGQKKWSQPLTEFFTKALKPFIKDEAALAKSVGHGNMFMSIIVGGMATLPPLLVLENNKVKKSIVQAVDKMIYGKDTVENDPKFAKAHEEILHAPKKDFTIGMITRFIALSPLLFIVINQHTRPLADKYWFNPLAKGTKALSKAVGIQPKSLMVETAEHSQTAWDYIHASLAMDFGLGPFYATLHSYFYNMFAGLKADHKEAKKEHKAEVKAAIAHEHAPKAEEVSKKPEVEVAAEKPTPVIQQKEAKLEQPLALTSEQQMAAPAM